MVDVNDWTQEDKLAALQQLIAWRAGRAIPLGEVAPGVGYLPLVFNDPIQPGSCVNVSTMANCWFKPQRMVIFEPVSVRVLTDVTVEHVPKKWWRRRALIGLRKETGRVVREVVPRGAWKIHGIFVGQKNQFSPSGTLSGDLFGLSGTEDFDGSVLGPALSFTVQVSHAMATAVPFEGCVLGRFLGAAEVEEYLAKEREEAKAWNEKHGLG